MRKPLDVASRARVGDWDHHESFGFVPALGGSEQAASVERVDWREYQALLLQR